MKEIILMGVLCAGCAGALPGAQKIKLPIVDRSGFKVERRAVEPTDKELGPAQAVVELTEEERRTVRAVESTNYGPPPVEPTVEEPQIVEPADGDPSSSESTDG